MAALTGYNVSLAVSGSTWTPTVKKSVSGNITAATGGSAVTLPWIANEFSGAADTTTTDFKTGVQSTLRAMLNDFATNGAPT